MASLKFFNPKTGLWESIGGSNSIVAVESVPDYVRREAERVTALVQNRQNANTISFLLGSDIHARLGLTKGNQLSSQMLTTTLHAAQAMKIIREQVHLDFAGLLGDYLWDEGETQEQAMELYRRIREYFSPAFAGLPQFWARGNHDMLPSGGAELTDSQTFSTIGIHNRGAAFDAANKALGYCYRDFEDYKIRVVLMNTSETSNGYAVGTAQITWLQTVLDLSEKEGWKAVILSHIPLDWWGTDSEVYTTLASWEKNILCCIHGHTHNYVHGVVGSTKIPRIAIPNIDFYRSNTYAEDEAFGESTTYPKITNSEADTAFCVITIDLAKNKLYADHYGGDAGYDREIDLTADNSGGDSGSTGGYTNQIPISTTAFGGSEIYGGDYNGEGIADGYKTDTRIGSGFTESSVTGMCCTGFIPVTEGDVLRIKNVTLSGSATPYLLTYTATGGNWSSLNISVLGDTDSDGVYTYTIPSGTGAVRLSIGVIDETSIVTINEIIG